MTSIMSVLSVSSFDSCIKRTINYFCFYFFSILTVLVLKFVEPVISISFIPHGIIFCVVEDCFSFAIVYAVFITLTAILHTGISRTSISALVETEPTAIFANFIFICISSLQKADHQYSEDYSS